MISGASVVPPTQWMVTRCVLLTTKTVATTVNPIASARRARSRRLRRCGGAEESSTSATRGTLSHGRRAVNPPALAALAARHAIREGGPLPAGLKPVNVKP